MALGKRASFGGQLRGKMFHEIFALIHQDLLSESRREGQQDTGWIHVLGADILSRDGGLTALLITFAAAALLTLLLDDFLTQFLRQCL
jgi:hypothetical protein